MNLLTILRFLQFYTHNAHNLLRGATFFQDHEFLGELYPAYEADYDAVVERTIGDKGSLDLISIQKMAVNQLEKTGQCKTFEDCFKEVLYWEGVLCKAIEKIAPQSTQGTMQLIGDIANKSEMRVYKLKQRIGNATT